MGKNPPASEGDARDTDSIPESGRFPGGGFYLYDTVVSVAFICISMFTNEVEKLSVYLLAI